MKFLAKIVPLLFLFLINGNAGLHVPLCKAGNSNVTTKKDFITASLDLNTNGRNFNWTLHKEIENTDIICLLEIEEEQDYEKSGKKQILINDSKRASYPQKHQSLSCNEKEYLNSGQCYLYFSTDRYITFRTIRV